MPTLTPFCHDNPQPQLFHPYNMFAGCFRPKTPLPMAYSFFPFILFVFLFPLCALSQTDGNIALGSKLIASEASSPWLSPFGDFAFGFQQLQDSNLFLLSIWYNNIPDNTVVWYLNSSNPVPRGSTIEIAAQTGLVLRDPQGRRVWNTDGIANQADHGFMNDTGNFVLKGGDGSWLWESFGLPADTILPLQELGIGSVLNSRQSERNFSRGRFYLRFLGDGDLVLTIRTVPTNANDDVVYYKSLTSDPANASNSGYQVIFDSRGSISILKRNNQRVQIGSLSVLPSVSDNYFRATLDFDGVFSQYYHPRIFTGEPNWTVLWSLPEDICAAAIGDTGSGACGYNSICSLVNQRPICGCPIGYSLLDPNDKYGSCMPNSTQICGEVDQQSSPEELYDFAVVINADWPRSDYELMSPSSEADCQQFCLGDCYCAVAIFRNNSCWKKKLPLSNGWTNASLNSKAFLKYRKRSDIDVSKDSKPKDRETLVVAGSALLGTSFFINFLLVGVGCWGLHYFYWRKKENSHRTNDAVEANLQCFTYKELEEATNGFREELGRGSFGIVYKGEIQTGSRTTPIAVKKLDKIAEDSEKEFRAEMSTIGQTNHKNLVRLLGFCYEGQNRMLVYENMINGTLANFLFQNPKPSWKLRSQIAIGIARGLVYLHEECNIQIIHCDIKPQNVLLDDHFNARISDFGLAKLLVLNQSRTLTNIRGTKGYVAPEWFRNKQINAKVDVYSFGVLLLETISCQRCIGNLEAGGGEYAVLTDWAWDCFQEGKLETFVGDDSEALNDRMRLERFVMVGIWCIQEDSSLRPKMRKVSQMLEGIEEVMAPPCPSLF